MDHPQLPGGNPRSNLTPPEFFPQGIKGGGDWHFLPAKPYAPRLRRRDALRLPLADIFTLHLGHIAEDLQHQVCDEGPRQVLRLLPGVQQGHIQHHNVDLLLLGDEPPLVLDLPIVAAQPVNRFDDHQVAGPELPQKPLIEGPFKVLAAELVRKNVFLRNAELLHGDELAFLALVFRGYADVSIRFIHIPASYPFFIFIV